MVQCINKSYTRLCLLSKSFFCSFCRPTKESQYQFKKRQVLFFATEKLKKCITNRPHRSSILSLNCQQFMQLFYCFLELVFNVLRVFLTQMIFGF